MSQDVTPWLAEIQALKQQVADLQSQLHQAYVSTDNWQKRYEVEAQQRRLEIQQAQQTQQHLQQELQRLKGNAPLAEADRAEAIARWQDLDPAMTLLELRDRLVAVLVERDRLAAALEQEQAQHIATRQDLTLALGDAIERLTKEKHPPQPLT
jgi:chromosome segregation ATPase